MGSDGFTKPEVPESLRDMMKLGIEQARTAFETFAASSERAWAAVETSSEAARSNMRSLNDKIAEIMRSNAEANFALALKLAEAKDVGQAMELQSDYARKQMESFARQVEEIRAWRPRSCRRRVRRRQSPGQRQRTRRPLPSRGDRPTSQIFQSGSAMRLSKASWMAVPQESWSSRR
jgi:phasin